VQHGEAEVEQPIVVNRPGPGHPVIEEVKRKAWSDRYDASEPSWC
jgi:hypothetical protein